MEFAVTLAHLLDEVWQSSDRGSTAAAIAPRLGTDELLRLAVLEYAVTTGVRIIRATVEGEMASFSFARPIAGRGQISTTQFGSAKAWRELDQSKTLYLEATLDGGPLRSVKAADLLAQVQWYRDHSDSLVLLPADLRNERFADIGLRFGRTEEEVRNGAAVVPSSIAAVVQQ